MPQTHDLGRIFVSRPNWPSKDYSAYKPPLLERGTTQEIEPPYRRGVSLVGRLPFSRIGFVLGIWVGTREEDEALFDGLGGLIRHRDTVTWGEEDWDRALAEDT